MNNFRKRFLIAASAFLCVAVLVTLTGLYQFYRLADRLYEPTPRSQALQDTQPEETPGEPSLYQIAVQQVEQERKQAERAKREREAAARKRTQTFLLLGVDSRNGEQARSDSILLATVPPLGGRIHLMSIPRDTYVQVPGHGYTKINHAMSYGGLPLMKQTVEQFLNVPIDHTLTVDFDGFRKVVDELGGLDLVVEKDMNYDDPTDGTHILLRKGQALANGKLALDYARFRKDALADTGRMKRQQAVIRAMLQKGTQPSNWPKMQKFADIVGEHVKTDLKPSDWMRLMMTYAFVKPEQVETLELAGENSISPQDHLWYFFVNDSERERISRQLHELRRGNDANG